MKKHFNSYLHSLARTLQETPTLGYTFTKMYASYMNVHPVKLITNE